MTVHARYYPWSFTHLAVISQNNQIEVNLFVYTFYSSGNESVWKFPIMSSEKLGIWAVWCDPRACTIHHHHWGCPGTPKNASSSHNSFMASYKLECFSLAFSHWVVGIALLTTLLAQDMCMSEVGMLSSLHARHPELSFVPRRKVNLKLDLGETLTKIKGAKKGVSMLFIKITCVIM